jgi:hypothetical protein
MNPPRQSPDRTTAPPKTYYLAIRQSAYTEDAHTLLSIIMDYADAPNIWAQEKYHVESFHEPPKPQNPWTKEVIPQNASKRLDACQRCRMRRTKCDRQRPCQRCKYAGINANSCFSDKDQARESAPEVPDWARDNYIDPEARVREAQGMRYVHASSLVWLEPYKRQMKVTLQCPDYFDGDAELQILAADDIESVVQAAMLRDAHNTASDNQCPLVSVICTTPRTEPLSPP